MTINQDARHIIIKACHREHSHNAVACFYGIARPLVDMYLTGEDCGTLTARKVLRVEMARIAAEKKGTTNFMPSEKDRYKGTR